MGPLVEAECCKARCGERLDAVCVSVDEKHCELRPWNHEVGPRRAVEQIDAATESAEDEEEAQVCSSDRDRPIKKPDEKKGEDRQLGRCTFSLVF